MFTNALRQRPLAAKSPWDRLASPPSSLSEGYALYPMYGSNFARTQPKRPVASPWADLLYGNQMQPAPGYGGTMFTPGASSGGQIASMAPMATDMGRMPSAQSGGFLGAYGWNAPQAQPAATSAFMQRAAMGGQQPQMGGYGGGIARRLAEPAQPMPYASMPIGRATMPTVGSRNQSAASIRDINSRLLIDPTNIQAQFSSQLNLPSQDESALSAWQAMRNASPVTRESLLAQANNGGRLTSGLTSGIDDPNFNRDGRFFQGAVPTQDASGRISWTTRAAADPGAAAREARRLQHMEQLRARQGGDRPPQPYLQRGTAAVSSQSNLPMFENPTLQAQRKATQAERMARVTERASQLAEARKGRLEARRQGPSVMDMLMQRNPSLAVRLQEIQANERVAQGGWESALAVANAQGQNQLNSTYALTKGQLDVANARGGFDTQVAEKDAATKKYFADAEKEAAQARLTGEQRATATSQFIAWATANPNASAQQRNEMLQVIIGQQGAQAQPGFAQNSPWRFFNNPAPGQQDGQPAAQAPPAQQGPFTDDGSTPKPSVNQNAKIYANGKLNEADLGVIKEAYRENAEKAFQIAQNQYGLSRREAIDLINSDLIVGSWFWNLTPERPGRWESILNTVPQYRVMPGGLPMRTN